MRCVKETKPWGDVRYCLELKRYQDRPFAEVEIFKVEFTFSAYSLDQMWFPRLYMSDTVRHFRGWLRRYAHDTSR